MKDPGCTGFLQWSLPRLRFRWEGFRKVRKQICKRVNRRIEELGLSGFNAYREYLDRNPDEWQLIDSLCGVTISRFYRDRKVFDVLRGQVLHQLAKKIMDEGGSELRCWSAGCSSGEEPYTLQIIWRACVPPLLYRKIPLRIIATDINEKSLERAIQGCFRPGSLRDLPEDLRDAFTPSGDMFSIGQVFKENIVFLRQDIRRRLPKGTFHLILCRNLVFTYFDEDLQRQTFERILGKLTPGGIIVIGGHESLPGGAAGVRQFDDTHAIYQKETIVNNRSG
jgi:chemotaxis protein methyltransferase CheR